MKAFKDTDGREWTLDLNVTVIKRVKGLLAVNLLALSAGEPPLITRLGTDVCLLCDVLFAIVKPQADAQNVSDEQFGSALGGDVILAAQRALYAEMIDFFRRLGRAELATAVEKQNEVMVLAVQAAQAKIHALDIDTMVRTRMDELERTAGLSSTSSQGSSE